MLFPYIIGLFIGTQIGKSIERTRPCYYTFTDKIMILESKIEELKKDKRL